MHDDAGRFVDDEQPRVLVGDAEVRGVPVGLGSAAVRIHVDADALAGADAVALGDGDAVDPHSVGVEQPLHAAARTDVRR